MSGRSLTFLALPGVPEINAGVELVGVASDALQHVQPSARAMEIAARCRKDPRLAELMLAESSDVVRVAPNVVVTRHRRFCHGQRRHRPLEFGSVTRRRRGAAVARRSGCVGALGVIVSDSFGRPWRLGTVNVAIGVAGIPALVDTRGELDRDGRTLQVTQVEVADALAAGAGLAMGEAAEGSPIVLVRGFASRGAGRDGQGLIRPEHEDLFRRATRRASSPSPGASAARSSRSGCSASCRPANSPCW